jgi:hypothetical protein
MFIFKPWKLGLTPQTEEQEESVPCREVCT